MTRILLVDDSALIRSLISQQLIKDSYEVVTVNDGLEAVNFIQKDQNFDLIITDMIMPNLDGITMLERVFSQFPIPSIVVSTEQSPKLLERGKKANVKIWLSKPAPYPKIKNAIDKVLLSKVS